MGAILAIPLTLMAKALLIDIDPSTRWLDVLLRDTVEADDRSGASTQPTDVVHQRNSSGQTDDGEKATTPSDDGDNETQDVRT